jgi:hypothetical protein
MAIYVEDWSRDLTTNTAVTTENSSDERLRPVEKTTSLAAIDAALSRFAAERPQWRIANEKPLPADSPALDEAGKPQAVRHLIRSTAIMRYRDDVWLVIEQRAEGAVRLHADSRSRLGKGDLGQNPRNLRELLGYLSDQL